MKTLSLTVFERLQLAGWLNQQRGDMRFLRRAMRLLDQLELTDEEKQGVGFVDVGGGVFRWDESEQEFTINVADDEFALLRSALKWQEWPVNPLILAMLDKIEGVDRES